MLFFKECTIATKISEDIAKAASEDLTQVATGSSSFYPPKITFSHKNNQCKSNTEDYVFDDADGDTLSSVAIADASAVTGTCHSKIDKKFSCSSNHIMGNLNPVITQNSSVNNPKRKGMNNKFQTDLNSYFGVKTKIPTNAASSLSTTTKDYGKQSFKQKRSCPFYKKIPGINNSFLIQRKHIKYIFYYQLDQIIWSHYEIKKSILFFKSYTFSK